MTSLKMKRKRCHSSDFRQCSVLQTASLDRNITASANSAFTPRPTRNRAQVAASTPDLTQYRSHFSANATMPSDPYSDPKAGTLPHYPIYTNR